MVYVSSDAVFSGAGQVHYDESALPETITPYSVAKAAAETEVFCGAPEGRCRPNVADHRARE
ncbi:hypothetical protein [Streptomyces sp. NPDC001893]|uniref:hypothetical protein n=1 Tax=Streptomyces sp. NPDC001893 TaxID=3154530 RepID=UPI003317FD43